MTRVKSVLVVLAVAAGLLLGSAPHEAKALAGVGTGATAGTSNALVQVVPSGGAQHDVIVARFNPYCYYRHKIAPLDFSTNAKFTKASYTGYTPCGYVSMRWVDGGGLKTYVAGVYRDARASGFLLTGNVSTTSAYITLGT